MTTIIMLTSIRDIFFFYYDGIFMMQKVKDWQLLLLAMGIIMIEIIYTIPLLAVIYVNGDTSVVINENSPPFVNVS